MWIKRIAFGATLALGFAFGGAGAQAGGIGHQTDIDGAATPSGGAPVVTLVRGGGGHGGGGHGFGGHGFGGHGFAGHGFAGHGFAGYRGHVGHGYGGYRGYPGYRGAYWRGNRGWNYAYGRRWRRPYAYNYYGYYGGYPGYWGYNNWPLYTGLGVGMYNYNYAYNTTSCYQRCRAYHGPKYCRRYAGNYCY